MTAVTEPTQAGNDPAATDETQPSDELDLTTATPAQLRAKFAADVDRWGFVPTVDDDAIFMQVLRPYFSGCADANPLLFLPFDSWDEHDEPPYPNPQAKVICAACPIRTSCLGYAQRNDCHGTWGGTSRYQRRQLDRTRARATCPLCASDMLAHERVGLQVNEICLDCGMSWPVPMAAAAKVQRDQ
jgi:hypothetical protein